MTSHNQLRLAHLIMAHQDPVHIARLINTLCQYSDVYVHIDLRKDISLFQTYELPENCYFIEKRYAPYWGGYNAVLAEIELMRAAMSQKRYDRLVFLQGADYPIKSGDTICRFFEAHRNTEFLRACCCTGSKDPYFVGKTRTITFYDQPTFIKRLWNSLSFRLHLYLRRHDYIWDRQRYDVYWGSAQWALTGACTQYILDFYDSHEAFNRWFYRTPCPDETYFATVVMNSPFSAATTAGGPEPRKQGLVNWRNLHYFEYGKAIRTWCYDDLEMIRALPELYIRKVNTQVSTELLDAIDQICQKV